MLLKQLQARQDRIKVKYLDYDWSKQPLMELPNNFTLTVNKL